MWDSGEVAARIVRASRDMARRFLDGGTLVAFGNGLSAADARHVAVEFLHPVIVGKRALPAISIPPEEVPVQARGGDIALGLVLVEDPSMRAAVAEARTRGLLTVVLTIGPCAASAGHHDDGPVESAAHFDADYLFTAPTADPLRARDGQVTLYHLLWEAVHVHLAHMEPPCRD